MQDAINEIVGIMEFFPAVYKIQIVDRDHIILCCSDPVFTEKPFTSAIDLLEWCENNLDKKNDYI